MELAKNNPDNEVYALTSVTVEPSEEGLKIWHQAYLEGLSTKTVFQQLRHGQMTRGHNLTSLVWWECNEEMSKRSWFLSPCGNKS